MRALLATAAAALLPLIASGSTTDFDAEWNRLRQGRAYGKARTGEVVYRVARADGSVFETFIDVPESYEPTRRWPVRVQLHGGVGRPPEHGRPKMYPLSLSTPEIAVYPRGWGEAQWWHTSQVEHIQRVLERLKQEYNVDESRVYITGFSDGGTGAYFFGMRVPSPFCAIVALHGSLGVLANPASRTDGQMYPGNLVNRPMLATNGEVDRLYPAAEMTPMMAALERAGVDLVYLALSGVGHQTSWWPAERERVEYFLSQHQRVPHPARLSWETERTDRYNRVDWLVIDELGAGSSDQPLADIHLGIYSRSRRSGRVDVSRAGNVFDAKTRGVRRFTLLLSPDVIDFSRPVKVMVNGAPAFDGVVSRDRRVLRRWAERDDDRTVLYGAELAIEVK